MKSLNIKVNENVINNRCGTVSFKRGAAFYKANRVVIQSISPETCSATVKGAEEFRVVIEADEKKGFRTKCSCPALASVDKECQHVAAVLLALAGRGKAPAAEMALVDKALEAGDAPGGFFDKRRRQPSGRQNHFETRETLEVEFICEIITPEKGRPMFAIGVQTGSKRIGNLREFLGHIEEGTAARDGLYKPQIHCFEKDADSILGLMISLMRDEIVYSGKAGIHPDRDRIIIPPSAWEKFVPLLINSNDAKLSCGGEVYSPVTLHDGPLPLKIDLNGPAGGFFHLSIKGIENIILMDLYGLAICHGALFKMTKEECGRLDELQRVMTLSGKGEIPVPEAQIESFIEKVVPGLRKFGTIHFPEGFGLMEPKKPLSIKLYLDRVKNLLLAGLEFHYGETVLEALQNCDSAGPGIWRDRAAEERILAVMWESGFAKSEGGYFLQNEDLEYEFLYRRLPLIENYVQIYATTAVRLRIFKEPRPRISVRLKKERTNWLEFKFEMNGVSDQEVRDILAALEEKKKYYRLKNGSLMSLESREFEEIQRFLKAEPIQKEDLESGLNMPVIQGFRLLDSVQGDTLFSIQDSFQEYLDGLQSPDPNKYKLPGSLEPVLRDYQKQGFQWLKSLAEHGFGGILADDMGLGKSIQSIAYILSVLPDLRKTKKPVLIVCPSSLTYNWLGEFIKFAPVINAVVLDGSKQERARLQGELDEADAVITSYPLARRDLQWYENQSFHTVFFDEAQAFKNPATQTFRAMNKIRADHRFALTGTPIENSIEELWSIFHIVFPELFQGLQEYSHLSRKQIARRIRPFMLRRLKEDVLSELPEKIESIDSSDLLPDQKKLYAAYLAKLRYETLKHLDKETIRKNRIKILAGITRLRQICCHPALFVQGYKGSSAKFEQLLKLLEEARFSGRRVLVFSQFTKMLYLIGGELALREVPYFYLDGQTPSEERIDLCNRFNAGQRDFFLISLKAGGTGLNLASADTVILYDLWWNPAVEQQASDRAHRMGQKNAVQVIKLVARGTIEEKMNELQEKKRYLIEEIIDPMDKERLKLTEEDIREIFMG